MQRPGVGVAPRDNSENIQKDRDFSIFSWNIEWTAFSRFESLLGLLFQDSTDCLALAVWDLRSLENP